MRRICALIIVAAMTFAAMGPNVMAELPAGYVAKYDQIIHVHTEFDAYGTPIKSVSTTTTTIKREDGKGGWSEQTSVTTVISTWKGGSLKTDTAESTSTTKSSDGSSSTSKYTDTYKYTKDGKLESVSGSGTYSSYDGETKHTRTGTITRSFIVKDGQALLTSSVTSGTMKDKDGKELGTFSDSTTIAEADYQYLGGSWVPMKEVSTSSYSMKDGSSETITRTTTYTRDANGVVTGISQTATGTRVVVTGEGATKSTITFELRNYRATAAFDPKMGWYIASEDYDWIDPDPPAASGGGDPVLYGTVTTVELDGVTYYAIAAELVDILDGQGLQDADGEIWLLRGDQATTLKNHVGEKVMVMGDVGQHVGGAADGCYVLQIREDYGGGIVTENVEQRLASYQAETWYQNNLSIMSTIWQGIQYAWRTGVLFLLSRL